MPCERMSDVQGFCVLFFSPQHWCANTSLAYHTNRFWVSRYFWGRNFITQSFVIKTSVEFRSRKMLTQHLSCWRERSWCAFQAFMACRACWYAYIMSSRSSLESVVTLSCRAASMLERTDLSRSHEEQARLWGWLQEWRKWRFSGSPRAYEVQWSATEDASVTWTCMSGKVGVTSFSSENEFIHQPVLPIFNHLVSQLIIFQFYIEKQIPSNIIVRKHSYSSLEFINVVNYWEYKQ